MKMMKKTFSDFFLYAVFNTQVSLHVFQLYISTDLNIINSSVF